MTKKDNIIIIEKHHGKKYKIMFTAVVLLLFVCCCGMFVQHKSKMIIDNVKQIKSYKNIVKSTKLSKYVDDNKDRIYGICLDNKNAINQYYNTIYKEIINTVAQLARQNIITRQDKKAIFKVLKSDNIYEIHDKIRHLNIDVINPENLAKKNLLLGLSAELSFLDKKDVYQYLDKAIELNQFELNYYLFKAMVLSKNCEFNESNNILLMASSFATTDSDERLFYKIYSLLGVNYYTQRDYDNANLYYTNALIFTDYQGDNNKKFDVLVKLGDIMYEKGNLFEATNFYKYALKLDTKHNIKNRTMVLLNLSSVYFNYGDFKQGLKFAEMAEQLAKSIDHKMFISNAKLNKCLNYEYLGEYEKAKANCDGAIAEAQMEEAENIDSKYDVNVYLGQVYNYVAFARDHKMSEQTLNTALLSTKNNPLKRIKVLQKMLSLYSYVNGDGVQKVKDIYDEVSGLCDKYNIKYDCRGDILMGFVYSRLNRDAKDNMYYKKALKDNENMKIQQITLYSYMADFYAGSKKKLAIEYAKHALEIAKQVYRYDCHYIKYLEGQVESIENR